MNGSSRLRDKRRSRQRKRERAQELNGRLLRPKVKDPQRCLGELVSLGKLFASRRARLSHGAWENWLDTVPLDVARHLRELMLLADVNNCEDPNYVRIAVRLLRWCKHEAFHEGLALVIRQWLIVDWKNTAGGQYPPIRFIPGSRRKSW